MMKDYRRLKRPLTKKQNKSIATNVIVTLMSLILTLNNFIFNNKNYLQVKECAMGAISAPPFANIFMGKFEDTHIYPHIQQFCKLYLRYIDDLFLIWTGTKDQFKEFISNLNNQHPSIKFTYKISNTSIDFLHTTVYIKNRRIHMSGFSKNPQTHKTTSITNRNVREHWKTAFHSDKSYVLNESAQKLGNFYKTARKCLINSVKEDILKQQSKKHSAKAQHSKGKIY